MTIYTKLLSLVILILPSVALCGAQDASNAQKQGQVLSGIPQKIDIKARYLFYISGYIVHAGNIRPISPKFGVYEYEHILETFKLRNFVVISEARTQSPEIEPYAAKVAGQVRQLLAAGVPPKNITVVGASQGSFIAMLTSTYLKNRSLNYVLIGACAADDGFLELVDLHGNILFISERTDLPARCQRFRADATGLGDYKEVKTNTGQKHGFLYRPMREWVEPTIAWAQAHSKVGAAGRLEQELMRLQYAVDEAETKKHFAVRNRFLTDGYIFCSKRSYLG